ncbi:MAG: bifunctional diaminohydroxyphosphoribosylaminopyrimidine deaminase/5-amino-6-(5-phosphoribosylamino)uracil reductase RibD [Pyrinomonadaceae bacterium]|nr:bifunctional diaminohydroxyphosphoribosylaminopyrimidine deaminase/5-amino-6-(5-phosphoribosylamino)uracil reductase RibD [Pyrinomonadaceae bacterium]
MEQFSEIDLKMTRRALELAAKGRGLVSPSPLVGCVIASDNAEILGEGFYIYEDVTHAEILALAQAGERANGATAYVSLEPHNHHGRTPPCTQALINAGIRRVVCPIEDPNPLVAGTGFSRLREAGIEVVTGILADEASRLNEIFVHWHKKGSPFVNLKMAVSLDGRIATRTGDARWITNEKSLARVHEIRHEYDAILIGVNTAIIDNPLLTDRSGNSRRRKLLRIVLDNSLRLPISSNLAETAKEFPTLVFTNSYDYDKVKTLESCGIEVKSIAEGGQNLFGVLNELKKRDIQSVLVEGGASVSGSFFDAGLIDKFTFFIAPLVIGGKDAPTAIGGLGAQRLSAAMKLENLTITNHDSDLEISGYPQRK